MRIPFSGFAALNGATAARIKTVPSAGAQIFVTKATLSVTTHAAKFVKVQDDATTPVVIAQHTDAAAAAGVPSTVTWDFGKHGISITVGKNLDTISEAAGPAGWVYAEGYIVETLAVS